MKRRLLSLVLLGYLGCAAWMLTTRFAAWGDGLSTVVGQVARGWTITPRPDSSSGIDLIIACGPTYATNGVAMALATLFFGCTPLAAAGSAARRRRRRAGSMPDAGLLQIAALLQVGGVVLSPLAAAIATLTLVDAGVAAAPGALVVAALALSNLLFGVPALHAWRQDQAEAFGARRPLLVTS